MNHTFEEGISVETTSVEFSILRFLWDLVFNGDGCFVSTFPLNTLICI